MVAKRSGGWQHAFEQNIDHPNCRLLPVLTRPNVCHAGERAEQIVRLDVVLKDSGRDPTGDQQLDGNVEAVRGLIFGVPGLASVAAGVVAGRIIGRRGARIVLLAALLVQGGMTAPLILLGTQPAWLWLLIPALFGGFFGHITAVVAATVTATSAVPDANKGHRTPQRDDAEPARR
jgi:hypothetical protein